jgi:hypothetical protein
LEEVEKNKEKKENIRIFINFKSNKSYCEDYWNYDIRTCKFKTCGKQHKIGIDLSKIIVPKVQIIDETDKYIENKIKEAWLNNSKNGTQYSIVKIEKIISPLLDLKFEKRERELKEKYEVEYIYGNFYLNH